MDSFKLKLRDAFFKNNKKIIAIISWLVIHIDIIAFNYMLNNKWPIYNNISV